MDRFPTLLIAAAATFAFAAPASAEERWAAPGIDASETACISVDPCSLETAINGATAASDIVVTSGTYAVTTPLDADSGVAIHGEEGQPRPVLVGATDLAGAVLEVDGGVDAAHLEVRSRSSDGDAVKFKTGSNGDRLVLSSTAGRVAKIDPSAAGTVLSNSLLVATGKTTEAVQLMQSNVAGTTLTLRNTTIYAVDEDTTAVRCKGQQNVTRIVNSIVRGGNRDLDAADATPGRCIAERSSLRATSAPGATVTAPVTAEPALDANFRPLNGSNTIDVGDDAAVAGSVDLGGGARIFAAAVDLGAYEHGVSTGNPNLPRAPRPKGDGPEVPVTGGTPAGETAQEPAAPLQAPVLPEQAQGLPPAAPPKLGKSVLVETGQGKVLVRVPGTGRFIALSDASSLPVGTVIDTRKGAVTLSSALAGGKQQTGTFSGGMFTVRQDPRAKGMVELVLAGGNFASCPKARTRARARAAVARGAGRPRVVRRLWGKDKGGRFRTNGRNSVATVRGTRWLTEDRCNGTFTRVTEGAVDVRSKRSGKVRRVRAGRSLLVR